MNFDSTTLTMTYKLKKYKVDMQNKHASQSHNTLHTLTILYTHYQTRIQLIYNVPRGCQTPVWVSCASQRVQCWRIAAFERKCAGPQHFYLIIVDMIHNQFNRFVSLVPALRLYSL